jgi:hypothetical protein
MAYDEGLAQRIREMVADRPGVSEKKMFGGIAFMRDDLMLAGVLGGSMIARVGPEAHGDSLGRAHVREFDFSGRPMRGYVFVDSAGLDSDRELRFWLDRCERFVATLPPKAAKLAKPRARKAAGAR